MPIRLLTWNINGIRSLPKPFSEVLPSLGADIVCLQETKVTRDQLDNSLVHVDGYHAFFSFCRVRGGYSGVAVFCSERLRPLRAEDSLSSVAPKPPEDSVGCYSAEEAAHLDADVCQRLDSEGRCLLLEFETGDGSNLVLCTVYCPNADPSNEERMLFKMRYHQLLQLRADALLRSGRHVIIAGDLNVSHKLMDHCETAETLDSEGNASTDATASQSYSDALHRSFLAKPVRHWLNQLLQPPQRDPSLTAHLQANGADVCPLSDAAAGRFVDAFRRFHPNRRDAYTCWCSRTGARQTNYGNRIDYVLVSDGVVPGLLDCDIQPEVPGSDHCPVVVTLSDGFLLLNSSDTARPLPTLAASRLPEFAARQRRISDFLAPSGQRAQLASLVKQSAMQQKQPPSEPKPAKPPQKQPQIGGLKRRQASVMDFLAPRASQQPQAVGPTDEPDAPSACKVPKLCSDTATEPAAAEEAASAVSAASQWRQLLSGPEKPPLCRGHGEACLLRTVKKDGPNRGRRFWVCPRPEGSAKNADARCDTFLWVGAKK